MEYWDWFWYDIMDVPAQFLTSLVPVRRMAIAAPVAKIALIIAALTFLVEACVLCWHVIRRNYSGDQ